MLRWCVLLALYGKLGSMNQPNWAWG